MLTYRVFQFTFQQILALSNEPSNIVTYFQNPFKQKLLIPAIKNLGHRVTEMKGIYLVPYFKTAIKYGILSVTSRFNSLGKIRSGHFLLERDVSSTYLCVLDNLEKK